MQEKINDCTTNEDAEKLVQEFQEIIKKKTKKKTSNVCGSIFE